LIRVPVDRALEENIAGNIGESLARQMMVDAAVANDAPTFEEIVKDPDNTAIPVRAEPISRCWSATTWRIG
jgi:hypothetical protein